MLIKLKVSGLLLLFALSLSGCSENTAISSNKEPAVVTPQVSKVNINKNMNQAKSSEFDDYLKNTAHNERIDSNSDLKSGPKRI